MALNDRFGWYDPRLQGRQKSILRLVKLAVSERLIVDQEGVAPSVWVSKIGPNQVRFMRPLRVNQAHRLAHVSEASRLLEPVRWTKSHGFRRDVSDVFDDNLQWQRIGLEEGVNRLRRYHQIGMERCIRRCDRVRFEDQKRHRHPPVWMFPTMPTIVSAMLGTVLFIAAAV